MDPTPIDPDLIYAKTASGEEAMQQRTRVVQRNVRMVLILVDGNATVAELCDRTGNPLLTQNALRELEHDGFIQRRDDKDPAWTQGGRHGRRARANAVQPPSEFSTYGNKDESALIPSVAPGMTARRSLSLSGDRENAKTLPPPSSTPGSSGGPDSGTVFVAQGEVTPPWPPNIGAGTDQETPSLLARWRAHASRRTQMDQPDLAPIRRAGKIRSLGWPLLVMLGLGLLSAVVFLTAMFFPYALYLPAVEGALAQSTGEPAKVGEMRVSFYPQPGLLLGKVALGAEAEGNVVRVAEMRLQPALATLLSPRMVFRNVQLSGIQLTAETVGSLARMLESAARESARAGVSHVAVDKAEISFSGLGVDEMKGEFGLSTDGLLQSVSLHSPDRNLQLEARPIAGGVAIQLEGLGWRPAPKSPYLMDSLTVKGEILGNAFVIERMELRIFGGLAEGTAILRAERQPALAGEMSFERIDAKRFGEAFGIGGQFEGQAAGRLKLSATAESWQTLLSALYADGEFTMDRGVLGGIDLPEAVRRVSSTPATLGGGTRFEQLSGAIRLTPTAYRFSRLVMNAGLMQSTGQLEVSRDLQIRGRMDVQMRGRADHNAKSVSVNGPLKSPLLQTQGAAH